MSILCATCGYDNNPDDAEFCQACGAELESAATTAPVMPPTTVQAPEIVITAPPDPNAGVPPTRKLPDIPAPPVPEIPAPPEPTPPPTIEVIAPPAPTTAIPAPTVIPPPPPAAPSATSARLLAKQSNVPQPEYSLTGIALVGIFDPDSGPVDIDLEAFAGGDTVSRHHGEIYPENGCWMVKDLGSTNGIFIKANGQSRFSARITTPTALNSGDELAFGKVQFIFQSP